MVAPGYYHQLPQSRLDLDFSNALRLQTDRSSELLRELYDNDYLKDLPRRLAEYEGSSSKDGEADNFLDRMRSYEAAHEAVQQSRLAIFNLQQKAKGYASKLWMVQTKSEVAKASCGDGATISHNYSYQYGHHEPEVVTKLKKSLNRIFKQKTKSLVRNQFEEASCRLWIQDHIATFLNSVQGKNDAGNTETEQESRGTPRRRSSNTRDLERVKGYLDILFQFERSARRQPDFETDAGKRKAEGILENPAVTLDEPKDEPEGSKSNSILQSIQGWIALLAAALLQYGSFLEREYLTIQVLRSRQVAGWAANFIQCDIPTTWSDQFQNFYISELELVLCGTSLCRKEPLSDMALVLGSELEEEDYLALLDQLDLTLFFNRVLIEHKEMHSNDGSILQRELSQRAAIRLLTTTRRLFDIVIHSLRRLTTFPVVSKRISQMLCQLAQILGDYLLVLGPMGSNMQHNKINDQVTLSRQVSDITTTPQAQLDHILVDVARTLLSLPGRGLWTFMPSIPFKFMTSSTVAQLLEEVALDNIQRWIEDPAALLSIAPEANKLRQTFGRNPGEAVFLLTAMATMVTSRFYNNSGIQPSDAPPLEHSVALIVTFLMLDAAYLDVDIRRELTKPSKEALRSVCESYPNVLSFVLRFVEMNFAEMGDMAQYLFRELPLDEWRVSEDDFMRLRRLMETSPLSSTQSLFARYVFSQLPWSQESDDSDNEVRSRIPNEFRKELALAMAGMCVQHLSSFQNETEPSSIGDVKGAEDGPPMSPLSRTKSPENKFVTSFASSLPHAITNLAAHSGLHRSAEQTSIKAFMDWCWSMLENLDLTQVSVVSLTEASRLHVQDPGLAKYTFFNQGQLIFVNTVHLLLTEASRDTDQFFQEGWTTLAAVLQAGVGSVFLDLVGKLIPLAIIDGSDLTAHATRFGQLLHEMAIWKHDPLLATAGGQVVKSRKLAPKYTPEELVGVWCLLQFHLEHCKSSEDTSKVLKFWMSAVFSQKDWMAHQEYVQVLDVVCLKCFELGLDSIIKDALTEQQILLSIGFRRAPGMSAELMGFAQPGLDRVMDMLPERFSKTLPVPQGSSDPSLLMGTWSVKSFATNLLTQQAMVETSSIWFAYYVLLIETSLEREMRIKIGNYYHQHPEELKTPGNIKSVMRTLGITSRKTLQNFAIWRWAQHLLIIPCDTYMLPLFWQMFFYLYFGHVERRDLFYGYKFLETSYEIVDQLRDRLQKTYTYFGQEARKAIQNQDTGNAASLTALHEFYIALHGWISEPLLLTADIDLKRIRKDLMAERLITCRLPDPLECNSDLWKDLLIERKALEQSNSTPGSPSSSSVHIPLISHSSDGSPRSRTTSYDQARTMRKHSHAWQEQKIGNCLVKQSKDGPECYIPRMLVLPASIDMKTSSQSLFRQPTRTIREYCKAYHSTNEAYENLDTTYLTELSVLYHNEVKTAKLEIACDTTPNALCKRPAVIELKYEEIVLNENVKRSIVENRERARALGIGMVEQGLCLASLEITKAIETLLRLSASDPGNIALQDLSVQSFHYLCKELLDDARGYPPAQMILTSIVETLGMQIVAKDPTQTEPTLDLMDTNDFAVAMLHRTFYPAAVPREFVRLYQRIATCKEYGLVSKDLLLRQFDVQAWTCDPSLPAGEHRNDGPSVLDRLSFYEVAFTAMVAQQQLQRQDDQIQESTELSTRERLAIIKSHRELAGTLLLNFLQQDYIEYLRILFNTCGIMCLEPEVLEDFIRIMGVEPRLIPALLDDADVMDNAGSLIKGSKAFTNVGLSDYDMGCLVKFLADYFNTCQETMVRGNLLDRYSGYAVSIASLLTVVLCDERYLNKWMKSPETITYSAGGNVQRSSAELVEPNTCRMWRDTVMVFQPWISCLTNHAVNEKQFQRQQSGASRMLFAFVGTVSKMMGALQTHYRDTSPMLTEVFDFWLEMMHQTTLGEGCINQTMLIHQHFHRLEWKGLELPKDHVERTIEVAAELNEEIKIEFWTYFVAVLMEKADSDLRPRSLHSDETKGTVEWCDTESAFLTLGLTILQDVDLVASNDMEVRQQFLDRLWCSIIDTGDWSMLSTEELNSQVGGLKIHWDHAGLWDDLSSALGLMLYWMRLAVGLESTDLYELDDDIGTKTPASTKIRLNEDRVLIYFGYVMRLLQARLSSSAEDSQSVNFRMDTILLVITHLGHVLDQIAGSRFQEKHPVIHRPLLSLVGVLNQCSKGPSSLSSYAQSFDVVQRGLCRMISDVDVIQLDVVKVVCQRVNVISAMINLLEEAIEREFDIWHGHQGSSTNGSSPNSHLAMSGAVFGLEDTSSQQIVSPMPMMGHHTRPMHRYSGYGDHVRTRSSSSNDIDAGRQSWSKIKTQLEAPELGEDEFLEQALSQGAILTLYGRFLQRLDDCLQFDKVLELGQELTEVISKVDLMAIEPWKAYQSLLLLRMFFNLVAKESVHSILQSRFLNSLRQVCRTLEVWHQDRDSTKGMLSSIGMGTRSSFDTKFRLVIRIIYTYVVVRLGDKGVSIHQGSGNGHDGGILPWRKGRHNSTHDRGNGLGSPLTSESNGNNSRDTLIETLAQLPAKNKDYAGVFVVPPPAIATVATVPMSTSTPMALAMTIPLITTPISLLPVLASSPFDLVKKTIMSSTPPPSMTVPPRPVSSSLVSSIAHPVTRERKTSSHHRQGSSSDSSSKRMSFYSRQSRLSMTGGSWDDTSGSLLLFDGMSEPNGGPSLGQGLLATRKRYGGGASPSQQPTEDRIRLQHGTKNGTQDLEWAVQQIEDRRFGMLEAADVLSELMDRFYEGDDYFA
ncbi:Ectopic P granules protein 5 [Dissophora ornata]|nr:Ectopic P granules protein 5 [Dissophora ornata]